MSRTNSSSASVGGFFPGQLAPSPSGVATISVTCHFPGVPVRLFLRAPRACGPTGCCLLLRIEYQQERTTQPTTKRNLALAGGCEPLRCYCHLNFPWQVRIIEFVRVANAFVRQQFKILSAEGVAASCGEIRERHLVGAAHLGIQVVNLANESVWRKPFGHGVGI